jgi:hypothetical protein
MLSPTKLNPHDDNLYDNPFADSSTPDPIQDNSAAAFIEPDIDLTGQSTTATSSKPAPPPVPTGNIGASSSTRNNVQQPVQQQGEGGTSDTYAGEDTLDEPVTVTIVSHCQEL